MPVVSASMVCESTTANVTAALRESLGSSSNGGCSSVAVAAATGNSVDENGISSAALMPNGGDADDNDSLQIKLIASAKRVLFSKVDYEEVDNYGQAVLDNFKSKYVVIKPLGGNVTNGTSNGSNSTASPVTSTENGRALPSTATCTTNNNGNNNSSNSNANNSNTLNGGDSGGVAPSQNVVPNGVSSSSTADCNGDSVGAKVGGAPTTNGSVGSTTTTQTAANLPAVSSTATGGGGGGATGPSPARRTVQEAPQPKRVLYPRENVRVGWKNGVRKWQIGVGMLNIGNTCYLNSTLQALFHVPSLANWLLSEQAHVERCDGGGSDSGCIICAMHKTLLMAQTQTSPFRPYHVYSKLKAICRHLVLGRQEDAHEFLRYLVEAMEKSYLSRFRNYKELDQYSKETTPLNQILGGYLRSAVRCLSCGHVSVTFQHFQDLPLDIRKADTLEEALDGYFARERLEDMGYKCESCKKKVSATKQFYVERAPIVLCIQLKRFSVIGSKLNKQISIRLRLDLSKYLSPKSTHGNCTYKLVSMITHLGASQHCGHYTAIGLTENGNYYTYDDSYVRPISAQGLCNTNSYIMFYEMEHAPEAAPSSRTATVTSTQLNRAHLKETTNGNYQAPKTNGYPLSVKSNNNNSMDANAGDINSSTATPRMIGPQLPPGGLQNYSAASTTNSNGVNNSGGIKLKNIISNGSTTTTTNGGNPKIQIHFKNGPITSTASVNASSTTTATTVTSLLNGNARNINGSGGASPKGITGCGGAVIAQISIVNESSCNSDPEEGVSSTTDGYADCNTTAAASSSSLPSMPNLLEDVEDKSKLEHTSPETSVSSLSTTSLVPYDLESDDDNTGNTVIRRQGSQSPASVKSERSDKPSNKALKRSSSFSLFDSINGGDIEGNKAKKLSNGNHSSLSQQQQQSSKAKNKTDPNPIDVIFNSSPKLNGNDTNAPALKRKSQSQSPQLTLAIPETPASPTSDNCDSANEIDDGDDGSASPNTTNSHQFEPKQIQTKTGLWQVSKAETFDQYEKLEKKTSAMPLTVSPSKILATPSRTWANPFTSKPAIAGGGTEKAATPRQVERRTQFTGNGYKASSKFEEHIGNELLQQSHRGYGAPVSKWNGETNDIERELKNEAHDLRRQDLEEEDENEMDRGRQKKVKAQQENHATYEQTPGYNPFQEQDNQRRWKLNGSGGNNGGNNNTNNTNNNNANSYRYFGPNYRQQQAANQRNKFTYKRYNNHPYNKYQRIHQQGSAMNNGGGGGSLSLTTNNTNTSSSNYVMRRES